MKESPTLDVYALPLPPHRDTLFIHANHGDKLDMKLCLSRRSMGSATYRLGLPAYSIESSFGMGCWGYTLPAAKGPPHGTVRHGTSGWWCSQATAAAAIKHGKGPPRGRHAETAWKWGERYGDRAYPGEIIDTGAKHHGGQAHAERDTRHEADRTEFEVYSKE